MSQMNGGYAYNPMDYLGGDMSGSPYSAGGMLNPQLDPYNMLGGDMNAGQQQAQPQDPNAMIPGEVDVGSTPAWQAMAPGGSYNTMNPNQVLGGGRGGGSLGYGGQQQPSQAGLLAQYQQQAGNYNQMLPLYNQAYNLAGANQAFLQSQNAQQTGQDVGNTTQRLMAMGLGNTTVLPGMQNQAAQLGQIRGENISANAAQQKQGALYNQANAMQHSAPVQSAYYNGDARMATPQQANPSGSWPSAGGYNPQANNPFARNWNSPG